jgi:hypothetical protein
VFVYHGLALLVGLLQAAAPQRPITTPRDLLETMRARYAGKWYRTLTFVQNNSEFHPDSTVTHSLWREWLVAPGKLRIEFQLADSGSGMIFAADSQFVITKDSITMARPFIHPLLVLGFDVYAQPVERTLAALTQRHFDVSVLSEATWEGRPVWVVGAKTGDLHTRQFWVDKERLVFVRMLGPGGQDTTRTSDTRFNKYAPLAGGWVSAEVEFLLDGQRLFLEEYRDIRANVVVPDVMWDARRWKATRGKS